MLRAQIEERREAAREIRQTIDASRRAVEQAHADMLGAVEDVPPLASAASSPAAEGAARSEAADVKMEDTESAGDNASVSEGSEASALTPAQAEQAEVRVCCVLLWV